MESCFSPGKKHVIETIEDFYYSSHIPVKAIDPEGCTINTIGYNPFCESTFHGMKVMDKIAADLNSNDSTATLTICEDGLSFTVIYICPRNVERGVYVIGPYSTSPGSKNVIYKPAKCLPHLINFLRNIAEDTDFIRKKKECSHGLYVKKALDFIDSKFYEPITVNFVASKLGISKCYFCAVFKKDTNKTFTQVLNEVRIEKSKPLLIHTNQSIMDIAISVGYNSQNYYNMLFKKFNKVTPVQYRMRKK